MDMNFKNKIVLGTGGSRGIGAAVSKAFAEKGAFVAINYHLNTFTAEQFIKTLPGGGDHSLFRANIGDFQACQKLVEDVIKRYQRIDILINNAGIHEIHPIENVDYQKWNSVFEEILAVNLLGPARLMYLVSKSMMTQEGGRIVNISSRGAFRGEPDQPAYGASKAGLNALGQSLAQKLAPYGITVGTVAPGFVETDLAKATLDGPLGNSIRMQSPFQRVAKPEEVAHAVLFLASDGAVFSTGTIIDVNGASYLRS